MFKHTPLPRTLLILMDVKHTVTYVSIQLSFWRWTVGFETCRRHRIIRNKNINLEKVYFVGLYCIMDCIYYTDTCYVWVVLWCTWWVQCGGVGVCSVWTLSEDHARCFNPDCDTGYGTVNFEYFATRHWVIHLRMVNIKCWGISMWNFTRVLCNWNKG